MQETQFNEFIKHNYMMMKESLVLSLFLSKQEYSINSEYHCTHNTIILAVNYRAN